MDLKIVRDKLIGSEDQRAVSPVIGIILMVAITVILAAVIAAFVLDLGQGVESETQAGVTVEGDSASGYQVTWTSEGTANSIGNPDGSTCTDTVGETLSMSSSDDSVVAFTDDSCSEGATTIQTLE